MGDSSWSMDTQSPGKVIVSLFSPACWPFACHGHLVALPMTQLGHSGIRQVVSALGNFRMRAIVRIRLSGGWPSRWCQYSQSAWSLGKSGSSSTSLSGTMCGVKALGSSKVLSLAGGLSASG